MSLRGVTLWGMQAFLFDLHFSEAILSQPVLSHLSLPGSAAVFPAGQALHMVEPVSSWYLLTGQG